MPSSPLTGLTIRHRCLEDIPAIQACTGNELVQRLLAQLQPFSPALHLGNARSPPRPLSLERRGGFEGSILSTYTFSGNMVRTIHCSFMTFDCTASKYSMRAVQIFLELFS